MFPYVGFFRGLFRFYVLYRFHGTEVWSGKFLLFASMKTDAWKFHKLLSHINFKGSVNLIRFSTEKADFATLSSTFCSNNNKHKIIVIHKKKFQDVVEKNKKRNERKTCTCIRMKKQQKIQIKFSYNWIHFSFLCVTDLFLLFYAHIFFSKKKQ